MIADEIVYSHRPELRPDGTLVINNSSLKAIARCSTEALLHALGWHTAEESAAIRAGTAAHEALACYFRTGDGDAAAGVYRDEYQVWADAHVPLDGPFVRLTYENTSKILGSWLTNHPLEKLFFRTHAELVEIPFEYPLADGIVFKGKLDAVVTDAASGHLYVLDHKTTGSLTSFWLKQFRNDSQLSGYIWAAQQHTHRPVVGAIVNAIEFKLLPGSTRKCTLHGVPYVECALQHVHAEMTIVQRAPAALDEWRRTAIHLAERYRRLLELYGTEDAIGRVRTQGSFAGACMYCQYQDFCAAGRPLSLLPSLLVKEAA